MENMTIEQQLAFYLIMDYTNERQKKIVHSLQKLMDKEELSKDQISEIFLYIRELNMELKFPSREKKCIDVRDQNIDD